MNWTFSESKKLEIYIEYVDGKKTKENKTYHTNENGFYDYDILIKPNIKRIQIVPYIQTKASITGLKTNHVYIKDLEVKIKDFRIVKSIFCRSVDDAGLDRQEFYFNEDGSDSDYTGFTNYITEWPEHVIIADEQLVGVYNELILLKPVIESSMIKCIETIKKHARPKN